jgi:hypothetical protein
MQSPTISTSDFQSSEAALLRRALQSDALFSLLSSLIFIFAASPVARFLGQSVPSWIILAIGVSFLPFVYTLYWIASDIQMRWRYGRYIAVMNAVWFVASYLVLLAGWSQFTVAGRWFIALQAEVIFVFCVLEIIGLRRLKN